MDFLDSVGALRAAQRTTSADRCPRPVGTTARRGLRISRPRPALHRRGPVSSVARASAIAAAPASLSRVSRTSSVIARDHIRLVRRAAAAAGWRTHPAGAPLVRRRPRAVRAAPPPPPQTRPVSSASGPIQRLPRMPRSMTAARRREAASRKHNKLAPPLPPPPPRRFGQELAETSDLSIRQSYSELRPWRAARGELRGQSAPAAASGCVVASIM